MSEDLKAICPGTFDPVTNGHLDIIERAAKIFDGIIVAVAENPEKKPIFSTEERVEMLEECFKELKLENVEVASFDTLLVNVARKYGARAVVKGLRAMSDFEYEFQMSQFNREMDENVETFFMTASPEYTFLSSSGVKEVVSYGGCIEGLVPPRVEKRLKDKLGKGGNKHE